MGFSFNLHLPDIHIPRPAEIKLPPPIRIPPIGQLIKQAPLISKPLVIPPLKLPVKIDIQLPGIPPLHINQPIIRVPPLLIPKPPPVPKPTIDMHALKQSVGIIAGVVSLHPIGRGLVQGIMGIADASTRGSASQWLNDGHQTNGTLSMIPGGFLAQQIANDASRGKSGEILGRYVPDAKKIAITDAVAIGRTAISNPHEIVNTTKSVVSGNIHDLNTSAGGKVIKSTLDTLHPTNNALSKPSLSTAVKEIFTPISKTILKPSVVLAKTIPPPVIPSSLVPVVAPSTLAPVIPSTLAPVVAKTTIPTPPTHTPTHTTTTTNSDFIGPVIVLGILATFLFI